MVVLVVVAVACFSAGVVASARWLPPLADTTLGTLALFGVSGLLGASLCVIGIDIDLLVRALERAGEFGGTRADLVGLRITDMLYAGGTLAALAFVAYLLAPKAPLREGAPPPAGAGGAPG